MHHDAMAKWMTFDEVREAYPKVISIYGEPPIGVAQRNGEKEFCFIWGERYIEPYGLIPIEGGYLPVYAQ